MPKQLSKTEQEILAQLKTSAAGRISVCRASGRGAGGGFKRGGARQWDAAMGLIKKGLACEINRHREIHTRAGYTMWYNTLLLGLPE